MKKAKESSISNSAVVPPEERRARYFAGALAFERRLARELADRRVSVSGLQALLVLGRDLYRIASRTRQETAMEAAARAAAWRLKQGLDSSLVLAVLQRAMELLFPGCADPGRVRRMALDYRGPGL